MIKVNKLLAKKGFTLIELLVVIAIIGILATIIVASFTSAQQRGRDARRKADLDAVKKALELAKADCTGGAYYPEVAGASGDTRYTALKALLEDPQLGYIRNTPLDPSRPAGTDRYHYNYGGGTIGTNVCLDDTAARNLEGHPRYSISALLENVNDQSAVESLTRCTGTPGVPRLPAAPAGSVAYYICD